MYSACEISHNMTYLSVEIPKKYNNYIVFFNTLLKYCKLTKLVTMATFMFFKTCLKIEVCYEVVKT